VTGLCSPGRTPVRMSLPVGPRQSAAERLLPLLSWR